MEEAYDSHENYKTCSDSKIIPVIDLNKRGKKPKIDLFSELKIPRTGSDLLRVGTIFFCPATSLKDRHLLETPKLRVIVCIHVFLSLIALIVKRIRDFILKGKLIIIQEVT